MNSPRPTGRVSAVNMAQQLISEIAAIHAKLCLPMTPDQKADWQSIVERRLDALDRAFNPVDQWGRSVAQQKEDAQHPCCCKSPSPSDYSNKTCCAHCGFFMARYEQSEQCGNCGNWARCAYWCQDDEDYWEPRTWQTCRDCEAYVFGLSNHRKTCEAYIWNETHCDECGKLHPHAARPDEARCWCAYDQDDLNKMDLINRR